MRLIKDIAGALLLTVLWVVLIDTGMHLAQADLNPSLMMKDSKRLIHLRPGAHGWWSGEGRSYVVINSYGFHDREHTAPRAPGTLRIAVLGSSIVEADHVSYDESVTAVIQRSLESCPGLQWNKVEVLNFGVEGYSLPQQLITLEDDVWRFDPQVVIDMVALNNDVINSDRRTRVGGLAPVYFTVKNGQLVPDQASVVQTPIDPKRLAASNRLRDLMNHSQLILLVQRAMTQYGAMRHPVGESHPQYAPPANAGMTNAWAVSEAVWLRMKSEAAQHNAEFWIATADMNEQVDPDVAHRELFRRTLGVPNLYYADTRVAAFAEQHNIPHVTLAPALADYAEKNHAYLHGFFNTTPNYGHWNALGNRLAGELVAEELCRDSAVLRGRKSTDVQMVKAASKTTTRTTHITQPLAPQPAADERTSAIASR